MGAGAMFGLFLLEQVAATLSQLPSMLRLTSVPAQITFGVLTTIISILVFWALWRAYQNGLANREPRYFDQQPTRRHKWLVLGLMVIALIALIVAEGLIHSKSSENQRAIEQMFKTTPWLTLYFGVFGAPILEELIFRGLFFNYFFMKLNKRWVKVLGIIVNGLLFAQLHTNLWTPDAWVYFVMGAILATTYVQTKDIRFDIGLHFANNAFAMFSMLL
ncbi:CPBP family intramembrane glutamic endopeptidase [Furfurilactobacillus cerevisiae]